MSDTGTVNKTKKIEDGLKERIDTVNRILETLDNVTLEQGNDAGLEFQLNTDFGRNSSHSSYTSFLSSLVSGIYAPVIEMSTGIPVSFWLTYYIGAICS